MSTALMSTPIGREQSDEADLCGRVARGDEGAFEELVSLYQSRVVRLAHRLLGWNADVDDVTQEVFLTVLRKCGSFRGEASLWTWLTTITLNRCRSHHRRLLLRAKLSSLLPFAGLSAGRPEEAALSDELSREVRSAVAALPVRDREVVVLFYLERKSAAEIGRLVGSSTNAVEVRLHRARERLRAALRSFMKD